uniref:NXPE family member 2-like n=1 Tax=Ciona intestinalis TaxID=7719 RepID=UPI000180AF60|nr:NXPE family member 2-like [Ciona intestinalis]|eukprot:XP_002119995.3 NXPE family member 2-like [Ciona intestinalis]
MACQFKLRILTLLFISCYLIYIVLFTKTDGDGQRRVYPTPKKKSPTKYKEFLKNSPLYGLSYYETYGSVRSDFMDNENEKGVYQDWLVYFPEFADSLNKFNQQKHNPNVSFDTFGNSKVVIVDRKAEYKTGDIFEIQIASYDWKENKSSFGGDYFVAKLIYEKNNLYPDGISGAVTDHRNGTYSIRIPLLIPGQARLEVRLMIPLKGVADLISCTSSPKYLGTKYVSRYETNETTECNIDFKFADIPKDKICDYSNPRNQEPWFCIKPPSGKCPKITYENFDASASEPESAFAVKNINCNNGELQNIGSNRNILGSPIYVTVSPENSKPIQKLPPCATGIGTKAAEFKPAGILSTVYGNRHFVITRLSRLLMQNHALKIKKSTSWATQQLGNTFTFLLRSLD